VYRFPVMASHLSKVADFNLPHLHLAPLGSDPVRISPRPLAPKTMESLGYRVTSFFLILRTFSRFETIPACDGQTDRQTDGQTTSNTACLQSGFCRFFPGDR